MDEKLEGEPVLSHSEELRQLAGELGLVPSEQLTNIETRLKGLMHGERNQYVRLMGEHVLESQRLAIEAVGGERFDLARMVQRAGLMMELSRSKDALEELYDALTLVDNACARDDSEELKTIQDRLGVMYDEIKELIAVEKEAE